MLSKKLQFILFGLSIGKPYALAHIPFERIPKDLDTAKIIV